MMDKEYIDREATIEKIKQVYCSDCNSYNGVMCRACQIDDAILQIDAEPAADVAHVVHGEWVESPKKYSYYQYRCSVCGFDNYSHITRNGVIKLMKYCPNCGAKMDGGGHGN